MPQRWPLLFPLLMLSVGMVLSLWSGFSPDVTPILAVFLCMMLALILRCGRLFKFCAALSFFCLGLYALTPWLSPERTSYSINNHLSDIPIIIEGVIAGRPVVSSEGSRMFVKVERIFSEGLAKPVTGALMLSVISGDVTLLRGDRIRFSTALRAPRLLGLPGEFNYSRYLAFQGASATGYVNSEQDIVLIRAAAVPSWQRNIDGLAMRLGETMRRTIADEQVASVLGALLLGDQRRIPRDLADLYTRAGVNHILSISGFHIGIIAAFISVLFLWFLTRFEYLAVHFHARRLAVLVAVPAMLAYLFLTGAAPATTRSVIMLTVFALALLAERERDSINTLLCAAFLLVAITPPTLFDVSFQLSFLSLWGILLVIPVVAKRTAGIPSLWLRSLIQFVAASVTASCVTLLPVLFVFKIASFNGILTNFVIVPLLGYGAVLSGFFALPFVILFPAYADLLLWPAAQLVAISNMVVTWFSSLPVISFNGINSFDMAFFLVFMLCLTFFRSKAVIVAASVLLPASALAVHFYAASVHSDGRLHVTMLSVGQAESILIRLPDSSTLLVDGGGYLHDTGRDFGKLVLAPALGALHVGKVDRVIATHEHPDHSGGLPYIIKNFDVGQLWSVTNLSEQVRHESTRKKLSQRTLFAGDSITLPGPVEIKVLSPRKTGPPGSADENNINEQSLVFRISYGAFSMLFCADAGFEAEMQMLADGAGLKSTVLKVGHHGSRYSTSSEFLDAVRPEAALVSAGAGNRFGLPATDTIKRLEAHSIPLYRTDQDGTIELVSDGYSWTLSTPYRP